MASNQNRRNRSRKSGNTNYNDDLFVVMVGERVEVYLMGGGSVTGILSDVSRYEIALAGHVIPKHAISFCRHLRGEEE